jgi:DNA-binding NarL/FixJ family response regulator
MRRLSERRAVLLDPYPLWLDAVGAIVGGLGFDVVGKARSLGDALSFLDEHEPELFVTELDVPGADGVAWLAAAARRDGMRTIVLTSRHDHDAVEGALASGASAYVMKTAEPVDFAAVVRQSFTAEPVYVAGKAPARAAVAAKNGGPPLTKREVEILRLVGDGRSNGQIARSLWVTEQTVKFHLSNIYRKLHVANRTEASRWAHVRGLLGPASGSNGGGDALERTTRAMVTHAH